MSPHTLLYLQKKTFSSLKLSLKSLNNTDTLTVFMISGTTFFRIWFTLSSACCYHVCCCFTRHLGDVDRTVGWCCHCNSSIDCFCFTLKNNKFDISYLCTSKLPIILEDFGQSMSVHMGMLASNLQILYYLNFLNKSLPLQVYWEDVPQDLWFLGWSVLEISTKTEIFSIIWLNLYWLIHSVFQAM